MKLARPLSLALAAFSLVSMTLVSLSAKADGIQVCVDSKKSVYKVDVKGFAVEVGEKAEELLRGVVRAEATAHEHEAEAAREFAVGWLHGDGIVAAVPVRPLAGGGMEPGGIHLGEVELAAEPGGAGGGEAGEQAGR